MKFDVTLIRSTDEHEFEELINRDLKDAHDNAIELHDIKYSMSASEECVLFTALIIHKEEMN